MDDVCVYITTEWNMEHVRTGTHAGLYAISSEFRPIFYGGVRSTWDNQHSSLCLSNEGFCNGIAVFVLARHQSTENVFYQMFSTRYMKDYIVGRWYMRDLSLWAINPPVEGYMQFGMAFLDFWMDLLFSQRWRKIQIVEYGFEYGSTAIAFLEICPRAEVVSVDKGADPSIEFCKDYIERYHEGRHNLVLGKPTLSNMINAQIQAWADLVYISNEGDPVDEINCAIEIVKCLSAVGFTNNLVVMNNYGDMLDDGSRLRAWDIAVMNGFIRTLSVQYDTTNLEDTCEHHCWVVGTVVSRL